jgi:hypothetical protein
MYGNKMYLVDGLALQHIVIFALCDRIYICFDWKKPSKVKLSIVW